MNQILLLKNENYFDHMNRFEVNPDGGAACYVDLMIITDEWMKHSMHLWSVNNQITYSICPLWGRSWRFPFLCPNNAKIVQDGSSFAESLLQAPWGVQTGTLWTCLTWEGSQMLRQEGALEDSLRSSTLLEGFDKCSHVEHSKWEGKRLDRIHFI